MVTKITSDAKLVSLFLDMLAAEQGAGDNTLDAYRGDLEDFSEFAGGAKSGFIAADTQLLRDYLEDLDSRGFKSSTVARRLSALRHLFRFLLNEQMRTDDPDLNVTIRGDAKSPYKKVRDALDTLQQCNVAKVKLATDVLVGK